MSIAYPFSQQQSRKHGIDADFRALRFRQASHQMELGCLCDGVGHGASSNRCSRDGRCDDEHPSVGIGVKSRKGLSNESMLTLDIDSPALLQKSASESEGSSGVGISYFVPFFFGQCIKVVEIAELCPTLTTSQHYCIMRDSVNQNVKLAENLLRFQ
jgi:hypothetical protein